MLSLSLFLAVCATQSVSRAGGFDPQNFVTTKKEFGLMVQDLDVGAEVIVGYEKQEPQWGTIVSWANYKTSDMWEILVENNDHSSTLLVTGDLMVLTKRKKKQKELTPMAAKDLKPGTIVLLDGKPAMVSSCEQMKLLFGPTQQVDCIITESGFIEVSGVLCACAARRENNKK